MLKNIQLILSLMILSLCIFGGITLIAHPQRSKPKLILGTSMLFWALLICIRIFINPFLDDSKALFQPVILIIGSFRYGRQQRVILLKFYAPVTSR